VDIMAKQLTDAKLKELLKTPKPHGTRTGDGKGLFFRVTPAGAYWTYRYRLKVEGKKSVEREMSLGSYPTISLAKARALHADAYGKVKGSNIDLIGQREAAKEAAKPERQIPTFGQAADDYIATHEAAWRSATHRHQWRMTISEYCAPIRNLPVDQIDTEAVLSVLTPLWSRVPQTASILRGRIETILDAARARKQIPADRANPARWKGHLDKLLPKPKDIRKTRHHPAMPYGDMRVFVAKLSHADGVAPRALAYLILCAGRADEIISMTWDEVDLGKATWTVPGERMKMGREHLVPLSEAAMAILRRQEEARGKSKYVFPGAKPAMPLSTGALAMTMERLGEGRYTVHGFRSSFRSWCADKGVAFEVAESALAHTSSSVVAAYQRSAMLERRRPVMQAWANYLSEEPSAKVESIEEGRMRHRKATP
jgi:integrase